MNERGAGSRVPAVPRPLRIGLTGGIASGKSATARFFAELGVPVIDTDALARDVVVPGSEALAEIAAACGPQFIRKDGTLDRGALRAAIFADRNLRQALEGLLHPRIERAALAACEACTAPYLVLMVPLLLESGFIRFVDRVLVVDCPEDDQRRRLADRDGDDPAAIDRILAAQASRGARLAIADDVLLNTGSLAELQAAVQTLHGKYLGLARAGTAAR